MKQTILAFFFILVLVSCSNENCQVNNLMIDSNALPKEVVLRDSGSLDGFSKNSNMRMFYSLSGEIDIKHIVSIERFAWSAKSTYAEKKSTFFSTSQYRGPWSVPEKITFISSIADQYYIACGELKNTNSYYCRMIGRYGKYFTSLSARISDNGTSFAKFQELLELADKNMESCIK
jgi:hypothetical protein